MCCRLTSYQEVELKKKAENKHLKNECPKMSVQSLRNVSVICPTQYYKVCSTDSFRKNLATGGDGVGGGGGGSAQYVI